MLFKLKMYLNIPHTAVLLTKDNSGHFNQAECMITQTPLAEIQHPIVDSRNLIPGRSCPVWELNALQRWHGRNPTWPDTRMPIEVHHLEEVDRGDGNSEEGIYTPSAYVQQTINCLAEWRARVAEDHIVPRRQPSVDEVELYFHQFRNIMLLQAFSRSHTPPWLTEYWFNHPFTADSPNNSRIPLRPEYIPPRLAMSNDETLAIARRGFRIHLANQLIEMGHDSGGEYLYEYWKAHPISRASGDDDAVISAFRNAILSRQRNGNPITPEQLSYYGDI